MRRLFAASTLAALFLAPTFELHAQATPAATSETGTIRGRVRNEATGRYLLNARVTLQGTDRVAFTNEFGEFVLPQVPSGPVELDIFYTGLNAEEVSVTVNPGQSAQVEIDMAPRALSQASDNGDIIELDAFEVNSRDLSADAVALNEQRFAANIKNVVSTDAFGEVSQGNIGEFMKHIPGVTIEYDGNTAQGVQIRGFNSNFTNVTIDGGQVASAATNSTQNHSRTFGLDQASINNISRIEVTKLPTPANPANSLGGAVNLVTKSAFERSDAEFSYSAYLSVNSNAPHLKSPGPEEDSSFKTLPSFNATYTVPVNNSLGFVFTGASANQFNLNQTAVPVYTWAQDGADTYATEYRMTQNMNTTHRNSAGIKMDWRPIDNHLLTLSYYGNLFSSFSSSRRLRFKASNTSADHDIGYVHGDAANGYVNNEGTFQDRDSTNHAANAKWSYLGENWDIEIAGNYSSSANEYDDIGKGFFRTYDARLPNVRMNFDDIDNDRGVIGTITAYDASNNTVDITQMQNYLLRTVSSSPFESEDVIKEGRARIAYNFTELPFRPRLEVGSSINNFHRDIDYDAQTWNFVGPDGKTNTADDALTNYADPNFSGTSLGFGYDGFDYASPWLLYDLFESNPAYFQQTDQQKYDRIRNQAIRSATMEETITAHYAQLEGKFFDNRLRLLAGARYEKTEDKGEGNKQSGDPAVTSLPRNEARAYLEYQKRGASFSRSYDGIYPSAHLTYEIIPDTLQFRLAYARTIGRPALVNIVPYIWSGPNTSGSGPAGWVVTSNPGLEPWEANNYDASLEFYTPNNGSITASVFQKDITNFFGNVTSVVDQALIEELGLGQETLGWEYQTKTNVGDAKIQGIELGFNQPLTYFGDFARKFTVFANYTYLKLEGERASDFTDFIPRTANAGVKFNHRNFLMFTKLNYRGRQFRENVSSPTGGKEYIRSRLELDLNAEYQIKPWLVLFVAGRNVTNESYEWERYNSLVPEALYTTSYSEYGAQYTFGVKGNF